MQDKQRNSFLSDDRHCPAGCELPIPMKQQLCLLKQPKSELAMRDLYFETLREATKGCQAQLQRAGALGRYNKRTVFTAWDAGWNNICTTTKAGRGVCNSLVCIRALEQVANITPSTCNLASWKLRCVDLECRRTTCTPAHICSSEHIVIQGSCSRWFG